MSQTPEKFPFGPIVDGSSMGDWVLPQKRRFPRRKILPVVTEGTSEKIGQPIPRDQIDKASPTGK